MSRLIKKLAILFLLNVLDALVTTHYVSHGAIDLNPLVNYSPMLWLVVKFTSLLIFSIVVTLFMNKTTASFVNKLLNILICIYVVTVVNNVVVVYTNSSFLIIAYIFLIAYLLYVSVKALLLGPKELTTEA